MPITITPENPAGLVGPGLAMRLESSLPGPFPSSAVWTFTFVEPTDDIIFYEGQLHQTSPIVFLTPGITIGWSPQLDLQQDALLEGASVNLNANVQLAGGGPADDTGSATAHWSSQTGIPALTKFYAQQTGGGLTPTESQQLQGTYDSTFPQLGVDLTIPVTGSPSAPGGQISGDFPVPAFGLIVRILSVPEGLVPNTPDGGYWTPSLAVVRVFRGSDLWMRVPVHTETKMIPLFTDVVTAAVSTLTAVTWVANMHYTVYFREGVVGTVTEMRFP